MQLLRRAATAVVAVALCTVAACSADSPTTPTSASVAGTWDLQTVNGAALPYTVLASGTDSEELTGISVTATSEGSFTEIDTYRTTTNGQSSISTVSDAGTYTLNGTAITLTFDSDGSVATGTLTGNTLTIANGGASLVFQKQ